MHTSTEEETIVTNILSKLQSGQLPFDIFTEICRLTVTPVLEVVCFRQNASKEVEVALMKRADNDVNWPGMYHVPGAIISTSDIEGGFRNLVNRICTEKLKMPTVNTPIFVTNDLCLVKRGAELAVIYMIEAEGNMDAGEFHNVSALPGHLIESHERFINAALRLHKSKLFRE